MKLSSSHYKIALGSVEEIDKFNIYQATIMIIKKLVSEVNLKNSIFLIDGKFNCDFEFENKCIVKGDCKHYSIAAASILAKVHRDNLMTEMSSKFPMYGFDTNMGYGTLKHRKALEKYGICKIHRKSYKPVKKIFTNFNS